MCFNFANRVKGFSMIEILVAIAIIGFLATFVLISFSTKRAKARDAKSISEINTIGKVMEIYYVQYGHYPYLSPVLQEIPENDHTLSPDLSITPADNGVMHYHWRGNPGNGRNFCVVVKLETGKTGENDCYYFSNTGNSYTGSKKNICDCP